MSDYVQRRLAEISANPSLRNPAPKRDAPQQVRQPVPPLRGTKLGFVYFCTDDADAFKIGFTTNLAARMTTLSTGRTSKLSVTQCFYTYAEAERMVHKRFAPDRIRGEWFRATSDLEELFDDIQDYQEMCFTVEDDFTDVFIGLDELATILEYIDRPWPKWFLESARFAAGSSRVARSRPNR